MPEGRQSPAPEQQSGRQQQDPPGSGHGINKTDDKDPKSQLEARNPPIPVSNMMLTNLQNLSSNPKGITDDIVEEKFSKTEKK
ncbi:hypothetical protein CEK26_009720 [Fusarium fujikuroi]|uniref:Uncharacterized protein n=1 Tax=Fusarium fujikuroi TaxID=5127 RepID=A0A5Q3DGM8_FUSFU|nr:Uncharacterized protein LW94_8929 [Fusarium fujikuroi]QGI65770.1 hypothetical protein CEK27_009741 [Fusarium fujikuroi]QGI83012.1 hypothetical protein CEK25_009741 [Fusarium fujikuroi]QGI96651.1 hypothetical protein CEK26_009720 [Fusarium fujikuroi]SCN85851.1 uncharacterized protein FFM5_03767 [Fusarium fujikuroi]